MAPAWTESLTVGGVRVRPTARSLVVPVTPTPEHWLPLSNLDRVVNPTFSSAILIYSNLLVRSNKTFAEIIVSLKESLARTLVEFYPLAGRLALREDGLVDLHCNDRGAVFVEALVDADLEEVGGAQPMPSLSGLEVARLGNGPLYMPDQLRPMPTLVIQATQFTKCGSVAVVVNWHHTIADGTSGCHFMKSWSEMAMGKDLSLKPDHNRGQLRPRNLLNSSLINGYSTRNVQELMPPETTVPVEPAVLKCFPLTKHAAQGLKQQAKTEDCVYTSAEAISGHLWKCMSRARVDMSDTANDGRPPQTTRFFMFVDGRKKLALPPGYFGNVVCSACAVGNADDIVKKPISYAANLIKDATRNISGEYFRSLIDWVEEQGHAPSKSEHINSLGQDTAATFWTYFPLYEMDFGWGKPRFAARNSGPRRLLDGIAMMPSPDGPGNMVAILNLHADRLTRLEKDTEFSTAFQADRITRLEKDTGFSTANNMARLENDTKFSYVSSRQADQAQIPERVEVLQLMSNAWTTFFVKLCIGMLVLAWNIIETAMLNFPFGSFFDRIRKPAFYRYDVYSITNRQQGNHDQSRVTSFNTD